MYPIALSDTSYRIYDKYAQQTTDSFFYFDTFPIDTFTGEIADCLL